MKLAKLSLVAAIVLGGLVASSNLALAQEAGTNAAKKGKGGFGLEQRMERLDQQLKLTPEQKPKVKAVLEESGKKLQELRSTPQDERKAKAKEIMEEQNKKMKAILTAEQYKKYETAQQRVREGKGGKKGDASAAKKSE